LGNPSFFEDFMIRKHMAAALALAALVVAACSGHIGGSNVMPGNGMTVRLPGIGKDLVMYATMPKDSIGEELGKEGLGTVKSAEWKADVSGFTQQDRSQSLAFPPDTKITIHNLSKSLTHTLDVVKAITKPPAIFPKDVTLSKSPKGDGKLEAGYASGEIKPGHSVTVTLVKEGIYLIGCAFHYGEGMHDVLVVSKTAEPGPQATAPRATATPTWGSGSGSGSGWGGP
jgi:plastocyanin